MKEQIKSLIGNYHTVINKTSNEIIQLPPVPGGGKWVDEDRMKEKIKCYQSVIEDLELVIKENKRNFTDFQLLREIGRLLNYNLGIEPPIDVNSRVTLSTLKRKINEALNLII